MTQSTKQSAVITLLKRERAVTMRTMRDRLGISHMTAFRALRRYGYLTSYNFNSGYYALHDIPVFDRYGLWSYGEARFSRYGTLADTVVELAERSPKGATIEELQKRLGTRIHNQVSALCRDGRLGRSVTGGHALYLSADSQRRAIQEAARQRKVEGAAPAYGIEREGNLEVPPGLDMPTVLIVLVQMIRTPEVSAASLSRRLRNQNVPIKAAEIRSVMDFYSLGKKTAR